MNASEIRWALDRESTNTQTTSSAIIRPSKVIRDRSAWEASDGKSASAIKAPSGNIR
jgi:hypothetical protein